MLVGFVRSMRSVVSCSLLLLACQGEVRAPLIFEFESTVDQDCASRVQLIVLDGGCAPTNAEVYNRTFRIDDVATELRTLPSGRYGFSAGAFDQIGTVYAEGCTEVELPQDRRAPIRVVLARNGAPMQCVAIVDASSDAGVADAGSADAGPDLCAADEANAATTRGCNGPLLGPAGPNELGGPCNLVAGVEEGTCFAGELCLSFGADPGLCVDRCPVSESYVSRGGCPTGTRCIRFDDTSAFCLTDCIDDTDCSSLLVCYADKTCDYPS